MAIPPTHHSGLGSFQRMDHIQYICNMCCHVPLSIVLLYESPSAAFFFFNKEKTWDGERGPNYTCTHVRRKGNTAPCEFLPWACSVLQSQFKLMLMHPMEALFRRISIMRQCRSTLNSWFSSFSFTCTSDVVFFAHTSGWPPPSSHSAGHPVAAEDSSFVLTLDVHIQPVNRSVIRYRYRGAARITSVLMKVQWRTKW